MKHKKPTVDSITNKETLADLHNIIINIKNTLAKLQKEVQVIKEKISNTTYNSPIYT